RLRRGLGGLHAPRLRGVVQRAGEHARLSLPRLAIQDGRVGPTRPRGPPPALVSDGSDRLDAAAHPNLNLQKPVREFSSYSVMNSLVAVLCVVCLQDPSPEKEITSLIDKLVEVADEDIGYGGSWSGRNFAAVEDAGTPGARILDGKSPKGSPIIRDLVKKGAAAVPLLIAHVDDARKSKIIIKHKGDFGAMSFSAEYDYNARTAKSKPEGVNRDLFSEQGAPANEHTLTVGDLCFVALGQIVNRGFSAVRYQPTAIIVVNSPTRSKALLAAIRKEWSGFTPEKHRESLLTDASTPDFPG